MSKTFFSPTKRKTFTINAGHHPLHLGTHTRIMGILNATPDSFSHDGCYAKDKTLSHAKRLALKMIRDGADILDIGGESSRPGAEKISEDQECARVIPIIKALAQKTKIPLSIDTYKPQVAKEALDAGATIVNNIFGTKNNISLLKMVKSYNAAIVLMHIKGNPRTMQKNPSYTDLMEEICTSLKNSIEKCLEIGIKSDKIIIDPGIGFGKRVEHNLEIINRLGYFEKLSAPLLLGTSRKSFIGKVLNLDVEKRLMGTGASVCAGILRGAHIVRVHDVKAMKQVVTLTDAIINQSYDTKGM